MLRRRLTFPAAAIALALSLVLVGLGLWAGRVIVSSMSAQLISQMTEEVHRDVEGMIATGAKTSVRMVDSIARHDVPFNDPVALGRELHGLLSDEPDVQWLACGNEAGGMIDAGRLADGTVVFLMTDDFRAGVYREYDASPDGRRGNLRKSTAYFDPRDKPWYMRAKDTRARYWTEPFAGALERLLGVALSAPVVDKDGSFVGVCNVKLIFTALSDFMNSLRLGDSRAFIIDGTGQLIAASGGVSPVGIGADGKHLRLHASEAGDPIVRATAGHLGRQPEIIETASTGPRVFSFDDAERGTIYAAVDRFEAPGGIDWTIVSALPASDVLGPVHRAAYLSLAVGALIVALFLALGLWAARRALRPLTDLTNAAQAIAKGDWRELPAVPRNDEVGLLTQAFNFMTARLKETLDGLRRSEARLEEAQRITHVGYWDRDFAADTVTWSDETYRIYGLTPRHGMVTLAELQALIHPEDLRTWTEAVAEALAGGARYDLEYRVVRPDGALRIVHSQGDVTRDESGRPGRMFGTIQDVTESREAADALRETQMALARVNRVTTMGQLTASIAHEINQPVTAMVTNADAALLWLDAPTPDLLEVRQALERIVKDGKRAGGIIGRIRALIKKAAPQKDRLDVNDTVLEVIALIRSELLRNGVSLQTQLAGDLPPVDGDRIQLQQVVLNLIMNAVEAMSGVNDGARELSISSGMDTANGVVIAVRDSGPGLDAQSVGRLFDAFYTTKASGMGMGLSICRSIIEAHGGRIWATGGAPRGAVFQFSLPAHAQPALARSNAGADPVA
jgi:PAS domain S-box-containing protein